MASLKWTLLFVYIHFEAAENEIPSWRVTVPSSVRGVPGSCVLIPCLYDFPAPEKTLTQFTGIWRNEQHQPIYHPVKSEVMQQYRDRTELVGDIMQKNCSLKIEPLQASDAGPFYFRIEIADYDQYSYSHNKISIAMINKTNPIHLFVASGIKDGQTVSASCSAYYSCPTSPPALKWTRIGTAAFKSQKIEDGLWEATSTLSFKPTRADHKKVIGCTARYPGGQQHKTFKELIIKYFPMNVRVKFKPVVKEGDAVQMTCSGDAHPPVSSYKWQIGAQSYQGNSFTLTNISRHHTGDLYCIATNTEGRTKSSPVRLNVLYAPEVKNMSSCSREADMMKCVCIVESNPPSTVHFLLSDRVFPSTNIENHGSVTIGSLQTELGANEFILCLANNTEGNANLTLIVFVNKSSPSSLYIMIAAGAVGLFLILLLVVGAVKRCRGRPGTAPTRHTSRVEGAQLNEREVKDFRDEDCLSTHPAFALYSNMETDSNEEIYANA